MYSECGVFVVSELGEIGVFKGGEYKVVKLEPYGLALDNIGKTIVIYDIVALYENLINFLLNEFERCRNLSIEIDNREVKLGSASELPKALDYVTLLYILALKSRPSYIYIVGDKGRSRGPRPEGMGKIMARASSIPPRYVSHRPPPFPLPLSVEGVAVVGRRISGERYKVFIKVKGEVNLAKAKVVETEDLYRRIVGGLVSSLPDLSWAEYVFL